MRRDGRCVAFEPGYRIAGRRWGGVGRIAQAGIGAMEGIVLRLLRTSEDALAQPAERLAAQR